MNITDISVQLYSVRDALWQDLPATLNRVAQLGFGKVEPFDFVEDAERYAAELAAAGLTAPSAHAHLLESDDPARDFAAAAACGIPVLIDPGIEPESWTSRSGVAAIAERLNLLAVKGAEFGIGVGYHNHAFEIRPRIDGQSAFELLADLLDPAVQLEVDTYWAEVGGLPAADLLRRLGDRVTFIHVKDGPLTDVDVDQLPAGDGGMDIPAVLAASPRALRVIEFDDYRGDPFDGIAASLAYLRNQ